MYQSPLLIVEIGPILEHMQTAPQWERQRLRAIVTKFHAEELCMIPNCTITTQSK
jgi:hypothetical protein